MYSSPEVEVNSHCETQVVGMAERDMRAVMTDGHSQKVQLGLLVFFSLSSLAHSYLTSWGLMETQLEKKVTETALFIIWKHINLVGHLKK